MTRAYERDTYREIWRRECASRFAASAWFRAKFCPQGDIRGKEFLTRSCGQILLCTDGRGWYQEWGKPAQPLQPGDAVSIPAGVKHWHGAAKDSWFSHVAIEVPGQNCHNEWCEPVSAEDYALLP